MSWWQQATNNHHVLLRRCRLGFYLCVLVAVARNESSAFTTKHSSVRNHHYRETTTSSIQLSLQDALLDDIQPSVESKNDDNKDTTNDTKQRIPFILQRLGRGNKQEIEEITQLCVDVFFNEQESLSNNNEKKRVAPWKAVQLAYLRNYQRGDILSRNAFKQDQLVDLIVARRVYSVDASSNVNRNAKTIDSDCQIFNADQLPFRGESKLIAGEIIGYCEMMEKKFGLGGNFDGNKPNDVEEEKLRPYLGNLSVVQYARQSGVGSKLMDEGEKVVREWDAGHTEIVLQVEEDNTLAIQFYKRRGWEFVFADPTCRRYDTSGFFLKESRITKYAMIKRLDKQSTDQNGLSNGETNSNGESLMEKLRNSFFVRK
jgi:ribosomal protein S18 acetylase RimI-like enzyme